MVNVAKRWIVVVAALSVTVVAIAACGNGSNEGSGTLAGDVAPPTMVTPVLATPVLTPTAVPTPSPLPTPSPEPTPEPTPPPTAVKVPTPTPVTDKDGQKVPLFLTFGWETDFGKHSVPYSEIRRGGPPRDGIPPIDDPKFVAVSDAPDHFVDHEPVISFEVNGDARSQIHHLIDDAVEFRS